MSDAPDDSELRKAPSPQTRAGRGAHDSTAAFQEHVRQARSDLEQQVAHARDQFGEANERIKQRTGRDLIVAILIGLAIGVVVIASLIFFKWVFAIFALAVALFGTFELCRALQVSGRKVDIVPQVAFVFVLGSLAMVLLRQEGGQWWVLSFIIIAVASDTGAYATGLAFGRTPMAPRISPKKTWEGFAGAVGAALIAGVLLAWLMIGLPWWTGLVLGAVIVVTATAGDLGESMLKRDLGIKDMSSWLPGHGGVLDRLDSILPSAAAALALFYLLSPLGVA